MIKGAFVNQGLFATKGAFENKGLRYYLFFLLLRGPLKIRTQSIICFFCFSAFLLFCPLPFAFSQSDLPLRIELESAKDQQDYKMVSLSNNGVAVFYQSAILSLDTAQWVFIHYDTTLVRKNILKLKIPNLCQYKASYYSQNKLYIFLQKPAFKKDTLVNYLLEWNIASQNFQLYDLRNHKYPYLSSFKVADDHLFMIIDDAKAKTIIYYNYKTHSKQYIQFADDEITSIESFVVDTTLKKTYFCMFLKNKKNLRAELFATDYSGNIKYSEILPFFLETIYNSVNISISGKDSLLLTGGYSNSKDNKQKGCYSGIYTLLFTKNKFTNIHTHSFGALLAKNSEKNTKYLSEPNLSMSGHCRESNGKVFVITEVFYPEYQYTTSSLRSYGYYGYDPPTQIFSGFRFLNAYIFEFDKQGTLLNEWYFPIWNVLNPSFYHMVGLNQNSDGNTLIYYTNKHEIVSQFVSGQHILAAQSALPIELMSKTDILEYGSHISMNHWYDNNFLLSGYQYIKNSQRGKGKRYVFFINKMICE